MSVQLCEGVWRNRSGQRLVITQCKPDDDWQQWTDGEQRYSDNGSFYGRYGGCSEQDLIEYIQDLIEYIGPRPELNQSAEIERLKAEWQSEFTAAQQLRSEVRQLEQQLEEARDSLRALEADGTAMDHRAEGMKAAFLATITALAGVRS